MSLAVKPYVPLVKRFGSTATCIPGGPAMGSSATYSDEALTISSTNLRLFKRVTSSAQAAVGVSWVLANTLEVDFGSTFQDERRSLTGGRL